MRAVNAHGPGPANRWPADLAEEKAALGACLLGQGVETARMLNLDDFSIIPHREIFSAIVALVECGELSIEIGLLAAELRSRGALDRVGGEPYLTDLDYGVVLERPMKSRIRILRGFAERRRLIQIAEEIDHRALDLTQPVAKTMSWLQEVTR